MRLGSTLGRPLVPRIWALPVSRHCRARLIVKLTLATRPSIARTIRVRESSEQASGVTAGLPPTSHAVWCRSRP